MVVVEGVEGTKRLSRCIFSVVGRGYVVGNTELGRYDVESGKLEIFIFIEGV